MHIRPLLFLLGALVLSAGAAAQAPMPSQGHLAQVAPAACDSTPDFRRFGDGENVFLKTSFSYCIDKAGQFVVEVPDLPGP